jgi:DNA repair photolyase
VNLFLNLVQLTEMECRVEVPSNQELLHITGRGAQSNPRNRFEKIELEADFEQIEGDAEFFATRRNLRTEYFVDDTKSVLSENKSPDVPYRYSLNPYRGCTHGCSYCYARPTHEYLGLGAGLDFESKVLVKLEAPRLFREALSKRSWVCEPVMLSGVTDCYQPAERKFRITRRCLEVAAEFQQPVSLITKNALVTRDIDLLASMAEQNLARVAISLTSLHQELTRKLEPRTSCPEARLKAIRELSDAGIPVTVMLAPLIPGLNDSEIPKILEAAKQHGAECAGYVLLRLPLAVKPVFLQWLENSVPLQRSKIETLIQQTRAGQMNQSEFGQRMRGTGTYADHLRSTFYLFAARHRLATQLEPLETAKFVAPNHSQTPKRAVQLRLF